MTDGSRLEKLGVPEGARPAVAKWLDLLEEWNARIDLTAARSDDELHDLMLADALVLAARIAKDARVVDVGTGAGAPGLALALLRPDLKVTVVEPLAKRIAFLRTVLGSVARTDVVLIKDRVEAITRKSPLAWDVATSRATLAPASWIPEGLRLARETWALLAREEPPAIEAAEATVDFRYTWPLTGAERRAVCYVLSASRTS